MFPFYMQLIKHTINQLSKTYIYIKAFIIYIIFFEFCILCMYSTHIYYLNNLLFYIVAVC